jgi:hypothetical protein
LNGYAYYGYKIGLANVDFFEIPKIEFLWTYHELIKVGAPNLEYNLKWFLIYRYIFKSKTYIWERKPFQNKRPLWQINTCLSYVKNRKIRWNQGYFDMLMQKFVYHKVLLIISLRIAYSTLNWIAYSTLNCANRWIQQLDGLYPLRYFYWTWHCQNPTRVI